MSKYELKEGSILYSDWQEKKRLMKNMETKKFLI
jgi:hypothetical protein